MNRYNILLLVLLISGFRASAQVTYGNNTGISGSTSSSSTNNNNGGTVVALTLNSKMSIVGGSLTVNGNVSGSNNVVVNNGSTFIVQGNYTAKPLVYNRTPANAKKWYLISSPVKNEEVKDLIASGSLTKGKKKLNVGIATFNNNNKTNLDAWKYYQSTYNGADVFTSGKGFGINVTDDGATNPKVKAFQLIGSFQDQDVNIPLTVGTNNAFNLIGNPYTAFIPANVSADAINNILTVNSRVLAQQTIWFWDNTVNGGKYIALNQASDSRFIDVSQGFFVESKAGGGTFSFTKSMQSSQNAATFQRTSRTKISLKANDEKTDIFYINGTTTLWDNGYDSTTFAGDNSELKIYTQLVEGNKGKKLAIQSLPNSNYETMVIPVGITAKAGKKITFSATIQNLPTGIDVYFEDRKNGKFTKMNNENYTVTLQNNSDGVGQFYLHTSYKALSIDNKSEFAGVSIFKTANNSLQISGVQGKGSVSVFSVLGKKVLDVKINSNGNSIVNLPNVAQGVYIVQLSTEKGSVGKKVIL